MNTKVCKVCGIEKKCGNGGDFSRNGKNAKGLQMWRPECKPCLATKKVDYRNRYKEAIKARKKAEYEANKEQILENRKVYYEQNKDYIRGRAKAFYKENRSSLLEKGRLNSRAHYYKNKTYYLAKSNLRYSGKMDRTPGWLSANQLQEIENFYWVARDLYSITGEKYHVDHIIPLQGKNICGLHVPWNLQVLPSDINQSKSNKHDPALYSPRLTRTS